MVSFANETKPTCDEVLEACDLHVKALEEERTILYQQIEEKDTQINELESEVATIPWYWYMIGGALAGFVAHEVIK